MIEFSSTAWAALGLVAGIGVLAILNFAATTLRNQTYLHDTKVKVNNLRREYVDRAQGLERERQAKEVRVVGNAPLAASSSVPSADLVPSKKRRPGR